MEYKRFTSSLLAAISLLLFSASVLHAQVGLSVSPPRVYYTLGEGESGSQKVLVSNLSKEHMLNLSVTFGDWKYDDRGNNLMFPPDTLENSCVSWLSLPIGTYMNLEPGESREIDVMMTVPAILQQADNVQTAMLYVTQMNPVDGVDAQGAAIRINVRQGIKIYRKGLQPETKQLEPEIAESEPAAKPPESAPLPLPRVTPREESASALPPEIAESTENAIAAPKKTGTITAARLLGEFKPDYPSFSKRKNEEGRVDLLLQILADGSVGTVEILSSSGSSRLDKAAQNAAKQCPYAPALDENDRPIESTVNLSYIFRLNNE